MYASTQEKNHIGARSVIKDLVRNGTWKFTRWKVTISLASCDVNLLDGRYYCIFCPKICSNLSHLTEHVRCHTGEKPYRCPVCDKGFSKKWNMKVHQMKSGHFPGMWTRYMGDITVAFAPKYALICHIWQNMYTVTQEKNHIGARSVIKD